MFIETEKLIITEFTMDMAQIVQENSVDEDNKRFVPDEVSWRRLSCFPRRQPSATCASRVPSAYGSTG